MPKQRLRKARFANVRHSERMTIGYRGIFSVAISLLVLVLGSCTGNPGGNVVVLYSSIDAEYTNAVAKRFQEATGIKVLTVTDSEASKSTGLVNRLIAERRAPVADVFWSGEVMRAAMLKRLGLSESYKSPNATDLPPVHSDSEGHFTGFSARLRVIIFNKEHVSSDSLLPTCVEQLAEPRYARLSCIANPLFGTTSMHGAALFESMGDASARQFFQAFSENGGKVLSSNGEVRRRVAAGDFAFGLTDSDDVNVAILDGKPVSMIIPDQNGTGALLMPSAAVLIKGSPHPGNAKKLIDFLVSAELETLMAESSAAHIPLRQRLPYPPIFERPLSRIRFMEVDVTKLAHRSEELSSGFLKEWVERSTR